VSLVTVEQKLKMARHLINAATRQKIRERKDEIDALKCRCQHRHDRHALSCDINFTAGHCLETGCLCKWFLMDDGRPMLTRVLP
jgi:hypothetical protein